jgi:hypothetical protein
MNLTIIQQREILGNQITYKSQEHLIGQQAFDSGNLNWIIGDSEGWPKELVDAYFFTPVGDLNEFEWPYEQRAGLICPNGDVMLFDTGHQQHH